MKVIITNGIDKAIELKQKNIPKGKVPKAKHITRFKDRIEEAR